jgi:hypothetical protein
VTKRPPTPRVGSGEPLAFPRPMGVVAVEASEPAITGIASVAVHAADRVEQLEAELADVKERNTRLGAALARVVDERNAIREEYNKSLSERSVLAMTSLGSLERIEKALDRLNNVVGGCVLKVENLEADAKALRTDVDNISYNVSR